MFILAESRFDTGSLNVKDSLKFGQSVFLTTSVFFVFMTLFCTSKQHLTYESVEMQIVDKQIWKSMLITLRLWMKTSPRISIPTRKICDTDRKYKKGH